MANETRHFLSLSGLKIFLESLKDKFASLTHQHSTSDIVDYVVDNGLSPASTNPVQNKVITEALDEKSQVQIITSDNTETLSTFKVYKLSQEEYNQKLENNEIDGDAIYVTPEQNRPIDLSGYATIELVNTKADIKHPHEVGDVSGLQNALEEAKNHVTDTSAHADIREEISNLRNQLGGLVFSINEEGKISITIEEGE